MIAFMRSIDVELAASGELVFQQGLADPSAAKTVQMREGAPDRDRRAVPCVEGSLAGFWVVDVRDEARAIEIAAPVSQAADAAIEVRQCMDAPPDEVLQRTGLMARRSSTDGHVRIGSAPIQARI